jgi:hypothetical protein
VSSLAHHLICEYKVPTFLTSCWYATDSAADRKRGWFVEHARGASFRSLNLPNVMTRKMEHIFLASRDHLSIEKAIRSAELVALGVPDEFVRAIMATRVATDFRHGEFWRTFWMFLVANAGDVDAGQIGPMIDYIQAIRHDCVTVDTPSGSRIVDPPQPAFSMKGRTVNSMLRMMRDWHRSLGRGNATLSWARSRIQPWVLEESSRDDAETPKRWQMMELTNSAQLRTEGEALHHCVASYADRCYRGTSSIWSLRMWRSEIVHHVLTIEVDPKSRTVIQARGRRNRAATGKSLQLLQDWAVRERLRIAI